MHATHRKEAEEVRGIVSDCQRPSEPRGKEGAGASRISASPFRFVIAVVVAWLFGYFSLVLRRRATQNSFTQFSTSAKLIICGQGYKGRWRDY